MNETDAFSIIIQSAEETLYKCKCYAYVICYYLPISEFCTEVIALMLYISYLGLDEYIILNNFFSYADS